MTASDLEIKKLFLESFRYVDFDIISKSIDNFKEALDYLKESSIGDDFGEESICKINIIDKTFQEKVVLVEKFKSLNTRTTNAIHYLFDLRKTINKKYAKEKDRKKQELLDEVFFRLSKTLMDLPIDLETLNSNIEVLKLYGIEKREFKYFYQHITRFFLDTNDLKKTVILSDNRDLLIEIKRLNEYLSKQYYDNLKQQKNITLVFFLLAFLILFILFYIYRRVRQTSVELKAFRYAIENSDNSIVITDADRNIQYTNDSFEVHTGYTRDEVLGKNPNILKSDLLDDQFYKELNETLDRGEKWQGEFINRRKDGLLLYEKASIVPIIVDDELVQYLAIKLDITEYIKTQQKLQQSAVVYEMIGDGIIITDAQQNILSANPAFIQMFGYREDELIGEQPLIVRSSKQDKLFYKKMWSALELKNKWSGKIHNLTKSGKILPVWLTITVVRNRENQIENFIAIYTNLEEIIEMEEKADFLAYHDELTQLPNRSQVDRELNDILELAKTDSSMIAILFIDLDRFKVINDTLGHDIGDGMLIELSKRLKNIMGENDTVARFGGDEFIVIMNALNDKKSVNIMANRILSTIRKPIDVKNYHLTTTGSIGIALYPEDGLEKSMLIKHADSAMYHAKEMGKDNYRFYTVQLSSDVQTRLDLEQELLYALEKDELSLCYQPQYDLMSKKICGAEALLRWNSPILGKVSPEKFIPIAEETGIIISIGYYILEEASKAYLHWVEEGVAPDWIAINLSTVQFRQENMLEKFKYIVDKVGISPQNIEFEITERCMMEYTEENLNIIDEFQNMGCQISIDDFGTGYSSMSYLKSLALDKIKIDKSFIDDLPTSSNDVEVSMAILTLSHSLGYKVIAEGIENIEQEDFLVDRGCDYGQGYYFSKPLSSDEFIKFSKNRQKK